MYTMSRRIICICFFLCDHSYCKCKFEWFHKSGKDFGVLIHQDIFCWKIYVDYILKTFKWLEYIFIVLCMLIYCIIIYIFLSYIFCDSVHNS